MALQLVIPGVTRYQVYGKSGQRNWANTLDIDWGSAAPVSSGTHKALAEKIMDAYAGSYALRCSNQWTIDGCRWIDLNSSTGDTGNIIDTPTGSFPFPGAKGTDPCPANVSVLATKSTSGARTHRSGRTYLAGVVEADTTGNKLSTTALAEWSGSVQQMMTTLNGATGGVNHVFVVAGIDRNGLTHKSPVIGYAAQQLLATQRRRLRG
jgi:hypothetical protein